MHLRHYITPGGNFGDDLNLLLWPSLFPDLAQRASDACLYGIGTILGGRHDPRLAKVVLGAGRGDALAPERTPNWDFRWVRGPRTAQAFGLPASRALGDGAWLWDGLHSAPTGEGAIGLIPHHATWRSFDWAGVAAQAGLLSINPQQHPQDVVAQLNRCDRVLTESLHGAIFADAMGIPWAPCVLSYRFNTFKWMDWLDTLGRPFAPLHADRPLVQTLSRGKALGNHLARWVNWQGRTRHNALRPVTSSTAADLWAVADRLHQFSQAPGAFACSRPRQVQDQREQMLQACAAMAHDYGLDFRPMPPAAAPATFQLHPTAMAWPPAGGASAAPAGAAHAGHRGSGPLRAHPMTPLPSP